MNHRNPLVASVKIAKCAFERMSTGNLVQLYAGTRSAAEFLATKLFGWSFTALIA